MQWIAYLEFSHSEEVGDLTWDHVDITLPRTEKLKSMVRKGIPHSLRPQLWMRLSGISLYLLNCFSLLIVIIPKVL